MPSAEVTPTAGGCRLLSFLLGTVPRDFQGLPNPHLDPSPPLDRISEPSCLARCLSVASRWMSPQHRAPPEERDRCPRGDAKQRDRCPWGDAKPKWPQTRPHVVKFHLQTDQPWVCA